MEIREFLKTLKTVYKNWERECLEFSNFDAPDGKIWYAKFRGYILDHIAKAVGCDVEVLQQAVKGKRVDGELPETVDTKAVVAMVEGFAEWNACTSWDCFKERVTWSC